MPPLMGDDPRVALLRRIGDNPAMTPRHALVIVLIGTALEASASGLDQLKRFLAQTQSAQGAFSQTVIAKSARTPRQSSGTFAFQRPGRFRWTYDKPYPQTLVGDGERFWSYDPDLNQVTVKKIGQAFDASPAALLAGEDLEKNFDLKEGKPADGLEFVDAVPRSQEGTFQRVRVGLSGDIPQLMEIQDNFGQTTVLRLSRFQVNPAIPAGHFRFVPPKGADVVGE